MCSNGLNKPHIHRNLFDRGRDSDSIMTPHILVWLWLRKKIANFAIPSMTF